MTIPVTMPSTPVPATQSTIHLRWPVTGVFTASTIKGVRNPVADSHGSTGFVAQKTAGEPGALMFVGLANVDGPTNGESLFHVQLFAGAMAPDFAGASVTTYVTGGTPTANDYVGIVYPHTLTDGTTVNVGALNGIAIGGTNLGDATFSVDSVGYDSVQLFVSNVQGAASTAIWAIYAPLGTLTSRGLPYLPAGVQLADLGGTVTSASLSAQVVKYTGATNAWQAVTADTAALIAKATPTTVGTTGR